MTIRNSGKFFCIYIVLFMLMGNSILSGNELSIDDILTKVQNQLNQIDNIEYFVQKIDTFANGTVWNNKGYALIEKDIEDDVFGFSFYVKRFDLEREYIYKDKVGYHMFLKEMNYKTENAGYGFIGSPGGQMVYPQFLKLDTGYQTIELVENDNTYLISYKFPNNEQYCVKDIRKKLYIDKNSFLPIEAQKSSIYLDNKSVSRYIFSDIKTNSDVKTSIDQKLIALQYFEPKKDENKRTKNTLLNTKMAELTLSNIFTAGEQYTLPFDKLTLLDFWEAWCGHCVESLSEVEKLKINYSDNLLIIGIVSDDTTSALKLINIKDITFPNLVGNNDLLKKYSINSFPRYFLIDKNGILRKEYHGFKKDEIISDIDRLLAE